MDEKARDVREKSKNERTKKTRRKSMDEKINM